MGDGSLFSLPGLLAVFGAGLSVGLLARILRAAIKERRT